MKLVYFDESKPMPDHQHYHIGAVVVDEEDLASVEAEVDRVWNDSALMVW